MNFICLILQTPATSKRDAAEPEFRRRPGTDGLHGVMYEQKMAAFLFARALHKTEEFLLSSNVDDAGAFDDLVFRYRLKGSDVWKTCFIQLKHKEKQDTTKEKEKEGKTRRKRKEGTAKKKEIEGTNNYKEIEGTNEQK
jgi:hypothetical protein